MSLPSDLITLSDWQTFRGLALGANAQESAIISSCSARITEFCGRTFQQGTYTEVMSGNNTQELVLSNRPLTTAGLSVYEDFGANYGQAPGAFAASTLLTLGVDYALKVDRPDGLTSRCGILLRLTGYWVAYLTYEGGVINPVKKTGNGCYQVQYTAGYATVPLDVQQACMMLCAAVKSRSAFGEEYASESRENYNYTLRAHTKDAFAALPRDTLGVLARYRNLGVG